ncbi:hypothetical protein [Methanolobus chelungpuianus]|uniref:Uncharacterized protein n=1 Tax=Methanolobus chelungpuianus TaxID=502115 RepID=A0AAE3HA90_9EURY|nr:hypothetical protein [Methanolobus chelungpuianus]MCQ6962891.1 hypothetical protein [Methanolobus chelungpuianus]
MQRTDRLSKILKDTPLNAFISWAMITLLMMLGVVNLVDGRLTWSVLIAALILIIIAPALLMRKPSVMPSWYFIILAIMPIVGSTTAYHFFLTSIPIYFSVATIALLLAAEINWFTSVRMNSVFAVLLVVITTLAMSGLWHLLHWLLDINFGTAFLLDGRSQEAVNAIVMHEFIYATLAGIAAGVVFGWYFSSAEPFKSVVTSSRPSEGTHEYPLHERPMPIRKLLGISTEKQMLATRIMQGGLLLLLVVSILIRDLHTALNAIAGLAITFVPSLITRRYNIALDAGLTMWITLAILMDALGTFAFYDNVARWDNLTHTLSASVIAAAGYVLIRAIDIHTDEIYIPPRVMFFFILLFVLATGVLWEILEFLTDELTAEFGYKAILAQHGINDTMRDLSFDLLGAVFAATWGTAYLSDISYRLANRFGEMSARREVSDISEVIEEQRQPEVFMSGLEDKE